jgi:hypothetical protein
MDVSKKTASMNQIKAAIGHFHKGEIDCAKTLSTAAEGMLSNNCAIRGRPEARIIPIGLILFFSVHALVFKMQSECILHLA